MNDLELATFNSAESQEIAKQAEVELALLAKVEEALRIALDWNTEGRGNVRKLSTLRFVARSFECHLTRMRVLAEFGGYMHWVTDTKPHLAGQVSKLSSSRDIIQTAFERIIVRLELASAEAPGEVDELCEELAAYLNDLDKHEAQENELFHLSANQEEGGSG